MAILSAASSFGQAVLSLDEIMKGDDFIGHQPATPWWSPDSRQVFFSWNREGAPQAPLYRYEGKGEPVRLSWEDEARVPGSRLFWDSLFTRAVYAAQGDLFLFDLKSGATRRLTTTVAAETPLRLSARGEQLLYQLQGQLYHLDLQTGALRQLSDLRSGKEKKDPVYSPEEAYLRREEERLLDITARTRQREAYRKERREAMRDTAQPRTLYLGEDQWSQLQIDPSLRWLTWRQVSPSKTKSTLVPSFVSSSGYTETSDARPKVGEAPEVQQFKVYDRQRDSLFTLSVESLPDIRTKPAFLREYAADSAAYQPLYPAARAVIYHAPLWSHRGLAVMEIRAADNKDRWLVRFDPEEMAFVCLDHQQDSAWIGGPGISGWASAPGNLGWLGDGETIWFQSESSGYSHLYTLHVPSGTRRQLTQGHFEVLDVQLSRDKQTFYLRASAEGPFEQHFYHLPVGGGPMKRITALPGNHEVVISPDERQLAIRYSSSTQPWELYLQDNRPGAPARRLTHSTTPAFEAYPWRTPALVQVPASDGAQVPARLYLPRPEQANGAAVIFVHGAGYLQNVHRWWSQYSREFMFHHLLTDLGYTVLDMDFRASSGYGRDWRTAIYRHMGGRDLQDHIDGARYLVEEQGIFRERIGIYGGSYGGFITLMALFQHPGTFACGAALRAVTDWAHYNHPYTSNILNTPLEDSLAYFRSSPIYHSQGLRDPLLILHGMVDGNVQFQDVVRLSQRLIEQRKVNWEMAVYPVEDHGFREADSWADEYRRILRLFETYLK